jgi:competence protein ComEC
VWLDPLLVFALAASAGIALLTAPAAAGLLLVGVLLLVARRANARVLVGLLLCLVIGALRGAASIAAFDAERRATRDALGPPARCQLRGSVDTSPTWVGGRTAYVLRVDTAQCDLGAVREGTRVRLGGGPDDLARGDKLEVIAQIAPIELLFNLDLPNPLPGAARRRVTLSGSALSVEREAPGRGIFAAIDRSRARVRRRIAHTFARDAEPMARALVLGENDLDPDDDAAFRQSGLSHMLAVSGTHLVFAVLTLVHAVGALLARIEALSARFDTGRLAALFGVVLSLGYADFAGGSGSAWRAAYMLSAALLARALGRLPCGSRALGLSLALGWLRDPLLLFDISFLLSTAATIGLLTLGGPLRAHAEKLGSQPARWVGSAISTTLAAMIPCAPLLALLGSELTFAGLIANVVAAPIGEAVALPLCLVHAMSAALPRLEAGLALVGSGALLVVREIAKESAAQHWLSFPMPTPSAFHLAVAALLATALVLARNAGRALGWLRFWAISGVLALILIEMSARRAGVPRGLLRTTALAIGQGDSSLIDLPDGRLILVDAGGSPDGGADPGARVVLPVLRARRRTRLDIVVLTHPHPDHFGGLLAVLNAVEVGEIWDSGQGALEGAGPVYAELRRVAQARDIPIRGPRDLCDRRQDFGGALLRVLGPCPDFTRGRGANDNSIVFSLRFGKRSLLFTGDAETSEERELLASRRPLLAADVLKVGHHGSRTSSSSDLLEAVHPRLATISCGVRNRFGHPVPHIVARLASYGATVLRTDRDGALQIQTNGETLEFSSSYPDTTTSLAWKLAPLWPL